MEVLMFKIIFFSFFLFSSFFLLFSQDYTEDSLAVRAILDANSLDSIRVEDVTKKNNDRIVELGLNSLSIDTITPELGVLTALELLSIQCNPLQSLPEEIGNCTLLVNLELSSNLLTSLPNGVGKLNRLSHLELFYNKLTTINPELCNLYSSIKYANFRENKLVSLPDSIIKFTIPHGDNGLNLCYNYDLIFTDEQKIWANVDSYQQYEGSYCGMSIDDNYSILNDVFCLSYVNNFIFYKLSDGNKISIDVFDVKGKLIDNLLNTYKNAGTHSINLTDCGIKSGVCLIRIKIGEFVFVNKLIVRK